MSDLDMGNISDPGDADPSLGGDREQIYRVQIRAISSASECLDSGGAPEEEFECVIMGDGVVHSALRRFLDSIGSAAWRQPVHLDTLGRAMIGVLVSAGAGADLHRALGHTLGEDAERLRAPEAFAAAGAVAERRKKLHATVTAAQRAYTKRLDREAKAWLPPPLLQIYWYLRGVAGGRPLRLYRDGQQYGCSGPVVVLGLLPRQEEFYFSLAQDDPDVLVLGKRPIWPGEFPALSLDLRDALIFARLSMFVCGHAWSEDPFAGGAAWAEAAARWDAWAAAEPDEVRDPEADPERPI
jgi:hypothetical protein